MKRILFLLLMLTSPLKAQFISAGAEAAAKFDSITETQLANAIAAKIMFRHASVGATIDDGLDCIQGSRTNPAECRNYPEYKYDRRAWVLQPRGNSGWKGKIDDFAAEVNSQINDFDYFSFKFCYIDGIDGLLDPCGSPYSDAKMYASWEYLKEKMEQIELQHPEKKFIWWTIPLTQTGQKCTDTLNNLIRSYCRDNGKYLFDIADIQCHDSLGNKVTNSSGYEMAFSGYCGEQQPGAQACHPNWTGKIILAKAFWRLISDITNTNSNVENVSPENQIIFSNNQSGDLFEIHFPKSAAGRISIKIYDCLGKQRAEFNDITSVSDGRYEFSATALLLQSGIYFLAVNIDGVDFIEKFSVIK